ncbi:MAG: HEPN domain-containing protein [Deltaproteobacteria bacterium]|nr:HEPN domain-containing protein [Deltaproteobacteria bacterium]
MGPFRKKFKREYAKTLFSIAEGDLCSARDCRSGGTGRAENVSFHAEQAIEKSLKAVICHLGLPIPMVHDLKALIAALPDKCPLPPSASKMQELSEFATIRRYEEGNYALTDEELKSAIRVAEESILWAKKVIVK